MSHRGVVINPINQLLKLKSNQKPFVMLFQMETCGVCHAVEPRLKDMLEKYHVDYVAVDAGHYPEIAGQHQVFTVPTVIVWSENREILRESRFINFSKIERLLEFVQVYETDYKSLFENNEERESHV